MFNVERYDLSRKTDRRIFLKEMNKKISEKRKKTGLAETAADGFLMAAADSVPGVSGGTVAFILGFYDHFIGSIHDLFGKNRNQRRHAAGYLVRLGTGWACGMVLFMLLLANFFESNIYFLSSVFLGLTVAAIPVIVHDERENLAPRWKNMVFLAVGFAIVCGVTFLRGHTAVLSSGALSGLSAMQYGYLFLSGALAISAMVLPGISGSTLLLALGAYLPVVFSVKELLHLNFSVFPALLVFGAGIICGAAVSVRYINIALKHYRSQMVYLVLGLVAGSMAAIVMGPTTLSTPLPPVNIGNFRIVGFAVGLIVILSLELIKKGKKRKEAIGTGTRQVDME